MAGHKRSDNYNCSDMKKKLSDTLGCLSIVAIFAGAVEGPNGELTSWTVYCLIAAFILAGASRILE